MAYVLFKDIVLGKRPGGSMKLLEGASVTIYEPDTETPATIYSDAAGTAQANPLTTDSNGEYTFYGNGYYTPIASMTATRPLGNKILVSRDFTDLLGG
jgi:hypothetical protein